MTNPFEHSRSHWVRHDRYELKAAADGKRYITPGKDVYKRQAAGIPPPVLQVVSKCALREKKEEGPPFPGDLPAEFNRCLLYTSRCV